MPTTDNNTIKYNQGEKSMKLPFTIYADLECLLEKMSTSQNNPNESSTTKINTHHQVILYSHIVLLMIQKISSIIIEEKIVSRNSAKI